MADALFNVRPHRGRHERAAERQITAWRKAGHLVAPLESSALRLQARAMDLAEADEKSWAIGDATRTLLQLYQAFRPPIDTGPADEWAELVERLAAADADDSAEVLERPPT